MSRKYRQHGYKDEDRPSSERGRRRPASQGRREGPRSPRMMGFHEVFRCSQCGAPLPSDFAEITPSSQCPKCQEDLHTCKSCMYFDPASRFECSRAIPERVSPKDKANECGYFEPRTTVEKKTSSASQKRKLPVDPREAFERLFKK